uniref:Ankyrin repeat protein n=1 Tax=Pithovirus LCPAC406 TaxID=2506599 RepID=A0A481ZGU2_9VIRU|nr:MAG: hypothetical protein LCPAC406_02330 [Pithovirus LCPAC406]
MRYIINGTIFNIDPKDLPTGSTLAVIYEGDPHAHEFRINNSGMTSGSIQLIINVINKDTTHLKLLASDINWNDLMYTVNYLNLGISVSVDFIYPLFLTIEDRKEWYKTCKTRQTYICGYSEDPEDESKYVFGGVEEKEEELIRVCYDNDMGSRDSNYDIIGKNIFREFAGSSLPPSVADNILEALSHIPNLFVAGGYALAKFDSKHSHRWSDIDIFAYGDNALEHIKEGVRICMELAKGKATDEHIPVRTRYSITIPINVSRRYEPVIVQFILIKSQSKYQILNRFDIDASCIGFNIAKHLISYALPRFVRAFETRTNVTDPTRQSPTYIKRLTKYAGKGFNIAVPGFQLDKIKLSPNIMKKFVELMADERNKTLKNMNLTGLQGLVTSAFAKSNMTKGCITTLEEISDYGYVTTKNIGFTINRLSTITAPFVLNKGLSVGFVVDDVLNEGSRPFEIKATPHYSGTDNIYTYVPKYPIIELMDDDTQNGMIGSIHQVKTSFYGEYYEAEMEAKPPKRIVSPPRRSFRSLRSLPTVSPVRKSLIISRSSKVSKPIVTRSRIRRSKLRVISKPRSSTITPSTSSRLSRSKFKIIRK